MKPCREGRVTSKATDLSVKLDKHVLSQIFSLERVLQHSQTDRINPSMMALIDLFECDHVTARGGLGQLEVGGFPGIDLRLFLLPYLCIAGGITRLQHRII